MTPFRHNMVKLCKTCCSADLLARTKGMITPSLQSSIMVCQCCNRKHMAPIFESFSNKVHTQKGICCLFVICQWLTMTNPPMSLQAGCYRSVKLAAHKPSRQRFCFAHEFLFACCTLRRSLKQSGFAHGESCSSRAMIAMSIQSC